MAALRSVARSGPRTPDLGGNATTVEVGEALRREILKRR
jgi:isocitrate/isopropylmalate dehydrogenase